MIRIERGEAPAVLDSLKIQSEREQTAQFFERPLHLREQQRYRFLQLIAIPEIFHSLVNVFHGKCAYCERQVGIGEEADIDQFRPAGGAVGSDGSFDADHYWWLAYTWTNLNLACSQCISMKANRFPVHGTRAPIFASNKDLRLENALLLDPGRDDTEGHLVFSADGTVVSETLRGRTTIDIFGLNRLSLVTERKIQWRQLRDRWTYIDAQLRKDELDSSEITDYLSEFANETRPFIAMRRQFMQQTVGNKKILELTAMISEPKHDFQDLIDQSNKHLQLSEGRIRDAVRSFQTREVMQEAYSVEDDTRKEDYYRKRRLIERIEISNFKAIRSLTIEIALTDHPHTPWLLLLGENGTGKSSILQAVTLTLMGDKYRNELGLDASRFVSHLCRNGHVKIYFTGNTQPLELYFSTKSKHFTGNANAPKMPLLAYGATRLVRRTSLGTVPPRELSRTKNLFDPFVPLSDTTAWLAELPLSEFNYVARALKELILAEDEVRLVRIGKESEIRLRLFDMNLSLKDLSDGYQSVVALSIDIINVMLERWPLMEIAEGIVLIDEIDAHLHPRWKMQIVRRLRQVFPRIQFIVTTHDPLCLRGFHEGEVVVMQRDRNNRIFTLNDLPNPDALRIDQILTSEYFGLNSTIEPEIEILFNEYYRLLALRVRAVDQETRLIELKEQLLKNREVLGSSPVERELIEAADQFLADRSYDDQLTERQRIREQTRDALAGMWEALHQNEQKHL